MAQGGSELPSSVYQVLYDGQLREGAKQEEEEQRQMQHEESSVVGDRTPPTVTAPHTRTTCLVGNNALAVEAAAQTALSKGYHPIVFGTQFQGEARDMAKVLVAMAQHIQQGPTNLMSCGVQGNINRTPIALIAGDETTVTLPPNCSGLGGRNQELALTAAVAPCVTIEWRVDCPSYEIHLRTIKILYRMKNLLWWWPMLTEQNNTRKTTGSRQSCENDTLLKDTIVRLVVLSLMDFSSFSSSLNGRSPL